MRKMEHPEQRRNHTKHGMSPTLSKKKVVFRFTSTTSTSNSTVLPSNVIGKFVRISYGREPLPSKASKVFGYWLRGGDPMAFQHETNMM